MRWGTKNKISSSSIITRVLQASWFSKFKQKAENSKTHSKKNKNKDDLDIFPTRPRFYSMDEDDPCWRLSIGEEKNVPARRSTGGLMTSPVWSGFDHSGSSFDNLVLDIKRMKLGRKDARAKMSERESDIIPVEPVYMRHMKDDLKMELKEMKVKTTTKSKVKVKAYSPRTECKIRALEEMKRAKAKMKRGKREEEERGGVVVEGKSVFNSFAVAKDSFDPQRDFRDSMVEMIREKRIRRTEDLEELLACYLDLNLEEYHDVIIKVYGQVWFELKGVQSFDY